jgi:nucleotide-binding universal stress UspA family protein
MKMIVVGTEGSEHSLAAVEAAVELARETGAVLRCVSVDDSFDEAGIDPAAEHAAAAACELAEARGVQAKAAVRVGPAADQIIAEAAECDADMIVVGSRGRGAVASALLGSVALRLVRHSRWPVMVVATATAEDHASHPVRRFPFMASPREALVVQHCLREIGRGRDLDAIFDDPYVRNRTTSLDRLKLLDHPEIVTAVGEETCADLRRRIAGLASGSRS